MKWVDELNANQMLLMYIGNVPKFYPEILWSKCIIALGNAQFSE